MKLLKSSQSKIFHYDNAEERLNHIKEMEQEGWICNGQVKEFMGSFHNNDVEDESKYYYVGKFYKEELTNIKIFETKIGMMTPKYTEFRNNTISLANNLNLQCNIFSLGHDNFWETYRIILICKNI